jgi:hypothetical protein
MCHIKRGDCFNYGSAIQILWISNNIYITSSGDSSKIRNLDVVCYSLTTEAHPSLKSLFILEVNRRIANSSLSFPKR